MSGQKVTVVRCEEINVSGSFFRNKVSRGRERTGGRVQEMLIPAFRDSSDTTLTCTVSVG